MAHCSNQYLCQRPRMVRPGTSSPRWPCLQGHTARGWHGGSAFRSSWRVYATGISSRGSPLATWREGTNHCDSTVSQWHWASSAVDVGWSLKEAMMSLIVLCSKSDIDVLDGSFQRLGIKAQRNPSRGLIRTISIRPAE